MNEERKKGTGAKTAEEFSVVGKSKPRIDARDKVSGKLKYIGDIEYPQMIHGAVLRSPHPHALIRKIDVSRAETLPGVKAVVTAKDVPGRNGFGGIVPDQPVVCGDKVRFVGDGVAMVAAVDEKTAIQALKLIQVDYELLPALFSPIEALASGAQKIHDSGNLIITSRVEKGDVKAAFETADVVLERTYRVPFLEHAYLEPDVTIAVPSTDGTMTIYGSMQAPFTVRRNVAPVLGIPANRVRCVVTHLGGGFGGKDDSSIDTAVRAAVLAWKTGKPIRLEYSREEIMLSTCKRHPMTLTCKIGAKSDGTFVAFEGTIYDEQGAYAGLGVTIPPACGVHVHACIMLAGPYEIANVKVEGHLVYTNHPYGGAMRGFGAPQANFAHESLVDELADLLNIDPYVLRMKNCFKLGSYTATGQILDQSVGLQETMEETAKAFGWASKRKSTPERWKAGSEGKRVGHGMAIGWYRTSIGSASDGCGANVHLLEDGSVIIYQGLVEMGQGVHTGIAQIAAEALGVALEDVRVVAPDTDSAPESGPTVGSRSLTLGGNAILLAIKQIKEPLMQSASELLETPVERLVAKDRFIFDGEKPEVRLEIKEAARRCMAMGRRMMGQGWWTPPQATLDPKTGQGSPYFVYTYATQMAEVEVDMRTGEVTLKKIASAFDIGKAINPMLLEGQIYGGIGMGVGYALMEKVILDKGVIQNLGFRDYLIPTSLDVPEMTTAIIEQHNIHGPFGAKGVGEMPNIPTPAAINNAIANAIGTRLYELPIDSETVWKAIRG
ncbi:MAG: xanthine dehydrogenase family protein molybdopterin-binding subunit [Deltaproteobacteria bacterium]|nr:xanthine dehydrogenase family protein molybdopterin-binding subunit [Deltaproteobacteria bacterium]